MRLFDVSKRSAADTRRGSESLARERPSCRSHRATLDTSEESPARSVPESVTGQRKLAAKRTVFKLSRGKANSLQQPAEPSLWVRSAERSSRLALGAAPQHVDTCDRHTILAPLAAAGGYL